MMHSNPKLSVLHILFQNRADSRRIAVDIFLHRKETDVIASMFRSDASLVHVAPFLSLCISTNIVRFQDANMSRGQLWQVGLFKRLPPGIFLEARPFATSDECGRSIIINATGPEAVQVASPGLLRLLRLPEPRPSTQPFSDLTFPTLLQESR